MANINELLNELFKKKKPKTYVKYKPAFYKRIAGLNLSNYVEDSE